MKQLLPSLACFIALAACCNVPAAEPIAESPLKVTVELAKTKVHIKENFKAVLHVTNTTAVPQTIRVMNCSWDEHWQFSNLLVSGGIGWDCKKNFPVDETIAPGKAYTKEMKLAVLSASDLKSIAESTKDPAWAATKAVEKGPLTFKMGFTPIGSKQTYWSDEIPIEIIPD